ncbi:MAG: RNA-directed DNA polymerase [Cellvibrionaceae bacterium]
MNAGRLQNYAVYEGVAVVKRIGNLWPQITGFDNLLAAYYKARLGKQTRNAVANFSFNLEEELLLLQHQLQAGSYHPGAYRQFIIRERKPRLISAAPFRDRVVHHAVMNVLEPILDKRFYFHSYACRQGKGVHKAVDQYQQWAKRYAYVLKVDIARYFPSIRHDVLKAQLQKIIKCKPTLQLLDSIIDSSPSENAVGLPIGNLTSQYFANLYLNDVDHWLKQVLQVPAYCRYVDDLILLADDKAYLWQYRDALQDKLAEQGLALHARKQQLMRATERVDVLGYTVSRQRRWLRNDNGYRFQRKLKHYAAQYYAKKKTLNDLRPSIMSWVGHAQHGETAGLQVKLFRYGYSLNMG